jgi:hypothetical protein
MVRSEGEEISSFLNSHLMAEVPTWAYESSSWIRIFLTRFFVSEGVS